MFDKSALDTHNMQMWSVVGKIALNRSSGPDRTRGCGVYFGVYFVFSRCWCIFRFATRGEQQTCEGFFFYDESGCIPCKAAKVAEVTLLWTRMRLRLWTSPLEVTVLWLEWLLSVSTKVWSIGTLERAKYTFGWRVYKGIWPKCWLCCLFIGTHRTTTVGRVLSEWLSVNHTRDYILTVACMWNMI
jgi:hypothetical protein